MRLVWNGRRAQTVRPVSSEDGAITANRARKLSLTPKDPVGRIVGFLPEAIMIQPITIERVPVKTCRSVDSRNQDQLPRQAESYIRSGIALLSVHL